MGGPFQFIPSNLWPDPSTPLRFGRDDMVNLKFHILDSKFRTANSLWYFFAALFRQRRINSGFSDLTTLGNLGLRSRDDIS